MDLVVQVGLGRFVQGLARCSSDMAMYPPAGSGMFSKSRRSASGSGAPFF